MKAYIRIFLFLAALFVPAATWAQISITTSSPLPDGFVGQEYSTDIVAGGQISQPTTWSIVAGSLPPGLDLEFSNDPFNVAFVQGIPTQPGTFGFTVRFTSGSMQSTQKAFQLTIIGKLQITTGATLPQGMSGVAYSTQIRANGGETPYTWTVLTGNFPPGLMLNSQSGIISGTTPNPGSFQFLIRVADKTGETDEKQFSVRFVEPPRILSESPLPRAETGAPYSFQFTAAGGTPPYSWNRASPFFNLPAGLTLSTGGLLGGTPTVTGNFRLPIRVTDSVGAVGSGNFDLEISPGFQITTASPLPAGNVGQMYLTTLAASGGTPPYNWNVVSGTPPPGLMLDPQTGALQGTPTTAGSRTFTVRVRDAAERTREKQFMLTIGQGSRPLITTVPPLPNGTVGQRYMFVFAATGGVPPYRWDIGAGALPPGLSLNEMTGEISGTPGATTNVEFTITVTDTQNDVDAEIFRLTTAADPGLPPMPAFEPTRLIEGFTRQPRRVVRRIRVLNRGGGNLRFTVFPSMESGANWLSVSPTQVDASSSAPGEVMVSIAPPGVGVAGCGADGCTLRGSIVFQPAAGGPPLRVPVIAAVSPRQGLLGVAPQGLTFTGPGGGPHLPGQAVRVQNIGTDNINWETVVTTTSGGNNWLLADPPSGTAGPDSTDAFLVSVNPAGLQPGPYYGTVEVRSPSDPGGARLVTVVANILPAGANINPVVDPRGLVFSSAAGAQPPPTQPVYVFNPTPNPINFDAVLVASIGSSTAVRSFPGLVAPARERLQLDVQSVFSPELPRGVYRGFMKLTFAGGYSATVTLTLIVTPGGASLQGLPAVSQGACTPTQLVPELGSFSGGYPAPAGWPASLRVSVTDDCMNPLSQGTVIARFGNGNPADLALGNASVDGTWLGTLTFPASMASVSNSVTIEATSGGAPALTGSVTRAFEVQGLADAPPVLVSDGTVAIVNAASYEQQPLAPGSIVAAFGTGLSNRVFNAGLPLGGGAQAPSLPIPTMLGASRLFFGGAGFAPILFSLNIQVNAIVPYALASRANEAVSVRAERGLRLSTPGTVLIAGAQPAMFTQTGTGTGPASIVHLDGSLVTAANPAVAGEVILIFLTGLGAVTPAIQDGHPSCEPNGVCLPDGSNLVLRNTATPVSMTIGGIAIPQANIAFAGLAPGFAGLYQMNVIMPPGLASGDQPLKVTLGSQTSPEGVTIRIQ